MVSYVFQWAKSILIIYFDAQIVPDLLFLTTSVSFLLASSFVDHSFLEKKIFLAHLVLFLPKDVLQREEVKGGIFMWDLGTPRAQAWLLQGLGD